MSAISTDSRFFGLDLNQLKNDIRQTWRKAPQWPPLAWLQPEQSLTLVSADGSQAAVWESGVAVGEGAKPTSDFWAIELPEAMVLRKTLQLPPLESQDCASAAVLEAQSISPFPQQDLLLGFTELSRSANAVRMQVVLASRAQVEPYLQSKIIAQQLSLPEGKTIEAPEVWVFAPQHQPVVFQGFGEAVRAASGRTKLLRNAAGVGLAALLLAAIAITPTAQLRLRAIEAVHAYDAMAAKTGDVVAKRERLMQSADQVGSLSELLNERIDAVKVLSMLTTVLPDDTALQSSRIQGSKVTISGLTDNASTLMQKLSSQEGVKEVKAPSAATRIPGSNRESFTIELTLGFKIFGPSLKVDTPPVAAIAVGDAAVIAPANEQPAAAGALSPVVPQPPVVSSAVPGATPPAAQVAPANRPAGQRGPSLGGSKGPSLGGSKRPSLGGSKPPPAQGGHNQ